MAFFENGVAVSIKLRRRFNRSAAYRDIDRAAVGAGMNAARAFAHGDDGHRLEIGAIDDGNIAGSFIGDEDLIAAAGQVFGEKGTPKDNPKKKAAIGFGVGMNFMAKFMKTPWAQALGKLIYTNNHLYFCV